MASMESTKAARAAETVGNRSMVAAKGGRDPGPTAEVLLAMTDLVSDDNGEVVIFNDSGFRTLAITTDSNVIANGQADHHVTASGEDVSGFRYLTFDNGVTLYFEEGLDLVLASERVQAATV